MPLANSFKISQLPNDGVRNIAASRKDLPARVWHAYDLGIGRAAMPETQ
jgi:hypothetical protein